jgi:hypothetical protein
MQQALCTYYKILLRHSLGGTDENLEKSVNDIGYPGRDSNWASTALANMFDENIDHDDCLIDWRYKNVFLH